MDNTKNNPYYEEYYSAADTVFMFEGKSGLKPFEQIVSFQFAINNSKGPVYGYFSEDYDAIARGTRIVQGQFAVAMADVYDLNRILDISNPEMDRSDYIAMKDAKDNRRIYDEWIGDGFNISIKFGSYVDVDRILTDLQVTDEKEKIAYRNGTTLDIIDVHINNISQYIDANDSTCIMLVYSFFAKMAPVKRSSVINYIPIVDKNKITEEPIIEEEKEEYIRKVTLILNKDSVIHVYNYFKLLYEKEFNNIFINIFSNDMSAENVEWMQEYFNYNKTYDKSIEYLVAYFKEFQMYSLTFNVNNEKTDEYHLLCNLITYFGSYYDSQNDYMKKNLKKVMLSEDVNNDSEFRKWLTNNLT